MTAPRKATPARVRRSTPGELATPAPAEAPAPTTGFDPDVDFDMSRWRDEELSQVVEATRESVTFRLDDRRPDAPASTYVVDVPLLGEWPGKALRRLEDQTPAAIIDSLGLATEDAELVSVLDELKQKEVAAVLNHLTKASGVTPGESRPSGASSRSTRRR